MKTLVTLALITLAGSLSQAADYATCIKAVDKMCGYGRISPPSYQNTISCKIINAPGKSNDVVTFEASEGNQQKMWAVGSRCDVAKAVFSGIKENKVLDGWLWFTTKSGRLAVVDANANIFEILRNNYESYYSVVDLKIQGSRDVVLTYGNGIRNVLTPKDVSDIVNYKKYRELAE